MNFLLFHSEELEDSDGISVISESEMYKNHSNHSDNDETVEKPIIEEEEEESLDLLTPPVTPNPNNFDDNNCEEEQKVIKYDTNKVSKELEVHQENAGSFKETQQSNSHGVVLLIVMSLIIAVLYTNISSLKKDFATTTSIYEQRIARLEEENQLLKSQLSELIRQLKVSEPVRVVRNIEKLEPRIVDEKIVEQEAKLPKPITKDVWMGGEKEDVIKILDKKYNSLPDYCYFTDESDLFYEYNKENCERKKRKLERRVKKFREKNDQKAESVDEIYNSQQEDPSYDDFMQQTTEELLKSLNDEIQEIKSSRVSTSISDNDDEDKPYSSNDDAIIERQTKKFNDKKAKKNDEKMVKKLQKRNFNIYDQPENVNQPQDEVKKKRRKLQKQRAVEESSDDWIDRRTVAREEARKKNIDVDEENWFIKRNNEREIHRLELNVHN